MNKEKIRKKVLEQRRSLTSKFIEEASKSIYSQVIQLQQVKDAKNVMIYSDFDNEIQTANITGWLLYQGKQVSLPTIAQDTMYAANIKDAMLELSSFGIAQPSFKDSDIIKPSSLDVIILPGVAFDPKKNRVGFGKGYYDHFLKETKAYKIALSHDFQIVDNIAVDEHDVAMDIIITPDQVIE